MRFKLTRDSAGRLVVICEGCGATHLDRPHHRARDFQRTHADEHRRQRPRKGVGKGPRSGAPTKPTPFITPPLAGPSNRVTDVEDRRTP